MRKALILATALISWAAIPAAAQKPDIKGGSVVASEPGKAAVVSAVEISALVLAVDKASRTVTLKGPQSKVVDYLFVRYLQSLSLELQKVKSGPTGIVEQSATATARPGERPGAAAGREVTAIAKVTAVNPKASTITLKGPRGNSVTLDVRNPEQFKVVKVGDDVRVTYTEAVAISVEAAPKPEAKKAPKK